MNPTTDSTVYSRFGETARYVINTPEGHLVVPKLTVLDGEGNEIESEGSPAIWSEFFLNPPTEKLNEEVVALNKTLQTLREQIYVAGKEHRGMDKEIEARRARITQHEQLATLDKYLTQGISHYVSVSYGRVEILAKENTKSEYSRDAFKLLTLYGDTKGNLSWRLDQYADGSGGSRVLVYPACSLEEAKEIVEHVFEEKWKGWRTGAGEDFHWVDSYIGSAKKLGYPIPEDVLAFSKEKAIKTHSASVEKMEKDLEAAKETLEKIRAS